MNKTHPSLVPFLPLPFFIIYVAAPARRRNRYSRMTRTKKSLIGPAEAGTQKGGREREFTKNWREEEGEVNSLGQGF